MIKRHYFEDIEKELDFKEITVLIGSRRVGKTTIMQHLYEKVKDRAVYLTFDDLEVLDLFENNEKLFKEQYVDTNDIIFIDEIQYSKQSGRILKYLYDTTKKKFIVSGSSTPEISIHSISYLVGRMRVIEVFPIKFNEFIQYRASKKSILLNKIRSLKEFKQLKNYFEEFLKFGGYPRVISLKYDEKKKHLSSLVNTYLLKEIKDIIKYKNVMEFERFLRYLSNKDGNIINKSVISREFGLNRKKISEIIDTLIKTYVLYEVKPFLKRKTKEQIKNNKIYFQDTGFKNSLANNFNDLDFKHDKGMILENFILNSLIRKGYDVKFWNYKNRYEMDFVIEKDNKIVGIECKSRLTDATISSSSKEFKKRFSPYKIYVVNESIDNKKDNIEFINYYNFIVLLENNKLF